MHDFSRKNISHITFFKLTKFHCLGPFTFWDFGQYVYCDYLFSSFWSQFLKLTSAFLSSGFPPWPKKSAQKIKYLKNEKIFFDEKTFFFIFKGLLLRQIKPFWKARVRLNYTKTNVTKNSYNALSYNACVKHGDFIGNLWQKNNNSNMKEICGCLSKNKKPAKLLYLLTGKKDNKIIRTYQKHLRNNKNNNSTRIQTKAGKPHLPQTDLCCLNLILLKIFLVS